MPWCLHQRQHSIAHESGGYAGERSAGLAASLPIREHPKLAQDQKFVALAIAIDHRKNPQHWRAWHFFALGQISKPEHARRILQPLAACTGVERATTATNKRLWINKDVQIQPELGQLDATQPKTGKPCFPRALQAHGADVLQHILDSTQASVPGGRPSGQCTPADGHGRAQSRIHTLSRGRQRHACQAGARCGCH